MLIILSRGDAPSSLAPGYHIARPWRAEPIAQCWRAEPDWRCWRRAGLALLAQRRIALLAQRRNGAVGAQSGLALLARKRSNDIMPTGEK